MSQLKKYILMGTSYLENFKVWIKQLFCRHNFEHYTNLVVECDKCWKIKLKQRG